MGDASNVQAINDYWGRDGLGQAILAALAASGKNLDALTIDDLAPMDQFHGGGKGVTVRLARFAGLTPGMRVLDVGGGLGGGPALCAPRAPCRPGRLRPPGPRGGHRPARCRRGAGAADPGRW